MYLGGSHILREAGLKLCPAISKTMYELQMSYLTSCIAVNKK